MRRFIVCVSVATVTSAVLSLAAFAAQAPTQEQRQRIAEANKLKGQISTQVNARKYEDAAKSIEQLREAIRKLKDGGLGKESSVVALEKFVENQQKLIDRSKSKDAPKKDDAAASTKKSTTPEPSASGGVSFVKDVAPVFARNCQRCHGAQNPRSKFSLNTFASLMKGGERGDDDIVPGKPDESRLVLMLKGEEEPRMPQGGRRLRDELIEKIELWVKQGARFDGGPEFTTASTLTEIVPSPEEELKTKVAAMSDSELLELHKTRAKEHWLSSNPSKTPESAETEHFILMGSVPVPELEQAGQWAETALRDLNRMFSRSPKDVIWRGKLTIHIFAERHQYTELAMVIETRDVPREVQGHYFSTIETSYVAVPKPTNDSPATLKGLLVEQIAAAYLTALGDTPRWFSSGVGKYLAARSDGKAEIYREYRSQVREVVTDSSDPLAPVVADTGDAAVLGYGLIDFLVSQRAGEKGIAALGEQLRQKTATDKALQAVYGIDRKNLGLAWAGYSTKRYPAKKR
jgi:mono/diheme cytochrome c family protein